MSESIAIIGMSCRFPGAGDVARFWRMLCAGGDAIGPVPADRWDADAWYDADPAVPGKMNSKSGGFLDGVDQFDSDFFGIPPREADAMDPQQRLLLEVSWEALEDAGIVPSALAGSASGVFVGIASNNYASLMHVDPQQVGPFTNSGGSPCIAANRISYALDLRGPSMSVDSACSSALLAVHLACQSLLLGECSIAIAGGANVILTPTTSVGLTKARVLSPDGRCRVFDAHADGFGRGEGAGVVILKPLSAAQRDGDPIHAIIRGTASQQGGRSNGLSAPSRWGQEAVVRQAWQRAGISPGKIQYIETHSAGTLIGDATELNALAAVIGKDRPADQKCAVGSVKTNIGHLEAASGIAGLIKTVLMLKHQRLTPSLHFSTPNPNVAYDALPLHVQAESAPWPVSAESPLAGVSASGYGGVNVHVALEGAVASSPPPPGVKRLVFVLSAKTPAALRELAERYVAYLAEHPQDRLADICYTAAIGRTHFPHRLALAVESTETLAAKLAAFVSGTSDESLHVGIARRKRSGDGRADSAAMVDPEMIARRFVGGEALDHAVLFASSGARRVSLPSYPFQRRRHWFSNDARPLAPSAAVPTPAESAVVLENTSAAGGDMQTTLLNIWKQTLGVEQVGPDDDFFSLGGGSLMAMELTARIEQALTVRLEPRVLFARPTPAAMAQLLSTSAHEQPAPLLVPIRPSGSRRPIFFIAPDHLFHYTRLSKLMAADYPLYGLQPPYLDGFRQRGISIEQIADTYLQELLRVCPDGKCHLLGLCAGGIIAYEMAQRLRKRGTPVGRLILIDAPCPSRAGTPIPSRAAYIAARLRHHVRSVWTLPTKEAARYLWVRIRMTREAANVQLRGESRDMQLSKSLAMVANRAALYRHRVEPFAGRIDLVLGEQPYPSAADDTRLRWRELAGEVLLYNVPAAHDQVLIDPQVIPLAERLNAELNAIDNDPVSTHSFRSNPHGTAENALSAVAMGGDWGGNPGEGSR